MRKHFPLLAAALIPAAMLPFASSSAHAAGLNVVVAAPLAAMTGFATQNVTIAQGQTLTFAQLDQSAAHSVTSRETFTRTIKVGRRTFRVSEPYFDTRLVSGPKSVTVKTASLKPGVYHFYCTLHEGMTGTLTVK